MIEPHKEAVVRAMMGFAKKIRLSWANRLSSIPGCERLTDRDWALLEHLGERGTMSFKEALKVGTEGALEAGGSQAAVTAAIGRMSKQSGLLATERMEDDDRQKTVSLTEKGREVLEQRIAVRAEMYQKIIRCLAPFQDERAECEVLARLFQNGIRNADEVFGNDA